MKKHLLVPVRWHPCPLDVTAAMARSDERLETVMEEALEADFEKIAGTGNDRRERCVGEPFPIFSDAEAEDDNDEGVFPDEPQFVSRLVPLEELGRGASSGSGTAEQP